MDSNANVRGEGARVLASPSINSAVEAAEGLSATTTPRPVETRGAPAQPGKWAVFAVVSIGAFMALFDASIVVIGLPNIAHYFNAGLSGAVEWVVIVYLVVLAATMPTIGRITDMFGHKPIWITGIVIFTLGSALCGVAPTLGVLVGFRALEGLGGAIIMTMAPAMLTAAFPSSERGRAMGLYLVVVSAGVIAGPIVGGLLLQSFVWRVIFYVNVPLGMVGVVVAFRVLQRPGARRKGRFDPIGALLLAVGLAAVTLGLSFGQEWGWESSRTIAALLVGLAALTGMIVVELHLPDPVLDLTLFHSRLFAATVVTLVINFVALFAVTFLLPFYLEELHGYSTLRTGFLLTPLPLGMGIAAPLSGWMADRIGTRWLQAIGLSIACVGLVLISEFDAVTPLWQIVAVLILAGIGRGAFSSPNISALMGAAPKERQGVASGIMATSQSAGQSISVAMSGAIFAGAGGAAAGTLLSGGVQHGTSTLPGSTVLQLQATFVHGFHLVFLVCAAIAAVGVLISLVPERRVVVSGLPTPQVSDGLTFTGDASNAGAASLTDRAGTSGT